MNDKFKDATMKEREDSKNKHAQEIKEKDRKIDALETTLKQLQDDRLKLIKIVQT